MGKPIEGEGATEVIGGSGLVSENELRIYKATDKGESAGGDPLGLFPSPFRFLSPFSQFSGGGGGRCSYDTVC